MIHHRIDLSTIINWVPQNSRVLDLGCGDGTLLATLQEERDVRGYGLEIDAEDIQRCVDRGVCVIEHNIDKGLENFADKSFDTVVMTQALQVMRRPDHTLREMLRIGKECIVTFPNFGFWKNRFFLGLAGIMPVTKTIPYEWYDTPNIHFCTVKDFEELCRAMNIEIKRRQVLSNGAVASTLKDLLPNLFGEIAVYHLKTPE